MVSRQEFAPVEFRRANQERYRFPADGRILRRLQQNFKLRCIGRAGRRVQTHVGIGGNENGAGGRSRRLQLMPEGGEGDAQGGAALVQVGVWPEHIDEAFAGMSALPIESEIGQQGAGLMRFEPRNDGLRLTDAHSAQHLYSPRLIHSVCSLPRVKRDLRRNSVVYVAASGRPVEKLLLLLR